MSGIVETIVDKYNYVFHELADPRTQAWWGISNPLLIVSIVTAYLYFCTSLGPRLMKDRKPFELKTTLLIYNAFQVAMSIYLVYRGILFVFNKDYNLACEEIDYSYTPRGLESAAVTWWYLFAKITELLDTIFFVMRKKFNQVTFLHVYHHSIMSFMVWVGVKYFSGGHMILMGFLNSIVHVIMYSYYLLSGLGPQYQKYLWWKKHVTIIQLIQFLIVFAHNFATFFYECSYPKLLNFGVCINSVAFIYMFGNFYIRSYDKESQHKAMKVKEATRNVENIHALSKNGKEKSR